MLTLDPITLDNIRYEPLAATSWCATATISTALMAPVILWPQLRSHLPSQLAPYPDPCSDYPNTRDIPLLYWNKVSQQQPLSILAVAHHKRQQQRKGVRLLLKDLLKKLNITDHLDDSAFPYRLSNSGYYVCFSHSDDHTQRFSKQVNSSPRFEYKLQSKVAVAISLRCAIGIDIETQLVAWPTVQRYYHANELLILATLPQSQRDITAKYLWQLKESMIKINNAKLAQGLGIDYSAIIPVLKSKLSATGLASHPIKSTLTATHSTSIINEIEVGKTSYQLAILAEQQTLVVF